MMTGMTCAQAFFLDDQGYPNSAVKYTKRHAETRLYVAATLHLSFEECELQELLSAR
jgi:hypothetical protein